MIPTTMSSSLAAQPRRTQAKIEASRKNVEQTLRVYSALLSKPLDERQLFRPSLSFIQELVKSVSTQTTTTTSTTHSHKLTFGQPR